MAGGTFTSQNKIRPGVYIRFKSTAGAGLNARIHHGALLHLRDAGGDADDDTGPEQLEAAGDLVQELAEHALRHVVVRDDALPQGTHGYDISGGTTQHSLGLSANLQQLAIVLVDGNHRGLAQHHALTLDIYKDTGGS